jgi:hypothetical protein
VILELSEMKIQGNREICVFHCVDLKKREWLWKKMIGGQTP